MDLHKFADIYDKFEGQPHLQDIIKKHYYEDILRDLREEAKDAKFHLLDTLNYAFKNARQHQEHIYGCNDEDYLLKFMAMNHLEFVYLMVNTKHHHFLEQEEMME